MGQRFYLCAPDREEILKKRGTLRRLLFSGYAECLVDLLAVPVVPAGVCPKQSAKRLTLEAGLSQRCGKTEAECLERYHNDGLPDEYVSLSSQSMKRRMDDDSELLTKQHPERQKGQKQQPLSLMAASRAITFSALPAETHVLVFEKLTVKEAFCISLTSQRFWSVARRHLLSYYASRLGPWAGSHILNLGEDVNAGDHPPGLPESWEETLRQGLDEYEKGYNGGGPATLFDFAVSRFDAISGSVKNPSLYQIFAELNKQHEIPVRFLPGFWAVVCPCDSMFYPTDRAWILRNLKTCEYVRSEEIALKPRFLHSKYIHGPRICGVGFGEVVLMRTTWSSTSDNIGRPLRKDIHRGVWAGHRLDITTHDRLTEGSSKDATEWKDISKEVAKEIDEIWRDEFGDWRHTLMAILEDEKDLASGEHVPKWRYDEIHRFRAVY